VIYVRCPVLSASVAAIQLVTLRTSASGHRELTVAVPFPLVGPNATPRAQKFPFGYPILFPLENKFVLKFGVLSEELPVFANLDSKSPHGPLPEDLHFLSPVLIPSSVVGTLEYNPTSLITIIPPGAGIVILDRCRIVNHGIAFRSFCVPGFISGQED
jgi:hypothetical protein